MKIEGVVKLLKAKDDMKSNVTLLMISLCGLMLGVSIFMNILPSNPLLRPNIYLNLRLKDLHSIVKSY